jgi:hypothetical protein
MTDSLPNAEGRAAKRYKAMETKRAPYLQRARECAKLTLPYLLPDEGSNGHTRFPTPFNGAGPRGVLGLASKASIALLPPSQPFFRLRPDEAVTDIESLSKEQRQRVEEGLAKTEAAVAAELEALGDRPVVVETLKHLFVVGNALFYSGTDNAKVYPLSKFVVRRDYNGNPVEMAVKERITYADLQVEAPDLLAQISQSPPGTEPSDSDDGKPLDLYTHIELKGSRWHEYQEVVGKEVPGSRATYPKDKCPWLALRMIRVDCEDYGRSYVEQFLGDLKTLESLTKSVTKAAAIGAKVVFLVKPGSSTKAKTIAEADSGDIKQGNGDDVTVLQADKYADLRTALEMIKAIEQRLALAFLESTTVRRDAERVTAEEVRFLIQELEDALGGLYSQLTTEFQMPYVRRRIAVMQREGRLPKIPEKSVRIVIVTGVEALGRGHERTRLISWAQALTGVLGQSAAQVIDATAFAKDLAITDGLDWKKLIKDPEAAQGEQQYAAMQSMIEKLGPSAIREVGRATEQANQPQEPTPDAQAGSA